MGNFDYKKYYEGITKEPDLTTRGTERIPRPGRKSTKIPLSKVKEIKRMFFQGMNSKEIEKATGIHAAKINKLINNPHRPQRTWITQKEEISKARAAILIGAFKDDALEMREILRLGGRAIKTYLMELNENMDKGEAVLNTKDAKMISDLMANVHRIESLELNRPTDIVLTKDLTIAEIQGLIPKVIQELQMLDPGINYTLGEPPKTIDYEPTNGTNPTTPDQPQESNS